jgi:hypothetical protein
VYPGEAVLVKLSEPRLGRRNDDLGRTRSALGPLDPGQVRHRD